MPMPERIVLRDHDPTTILTHVDVSSCDAARAEPGVARRILNATPVARPPWPRSFPCSLCASVAATCYTVAPMATDFTVFTNYGSRETVPILEYDASATSTCRGRLQPDRHLTFTVEIERHHPRDR